LSEYITRARLEHFASEGVLNERIAKFSLDISSFFGFDHGFIVDLPSGFEM